ncbi:cytochrome C oxidase polypeptide V, mitochondrial precursor, putative [Candida dubliniensis CD36]|uniref:Cytochrome C oxidase polypeptide V, mitochondrial, putative n=1 Tax=Candida dubliniensis (strain CD36 / ATCC MYA-646 / CBS 7987 / NCPF 3949 / NRRL Y-17841) TaxID=573826 RepID=B9W8S6_CANDC|nr:cytochrome C oxidase polypeptide V, mitochondrial precursor, putative [Candida dubliniensis CD36]CAX45149.1 cytochrome C oxidase polypeptide V, mitochondrial precursor, putative [Candida dubliniensis CD36]
MFMRSLQRAATKANVSSTTSSIIRFNSTVAKSSTTTPRALSNAYIGNLESRWTSLPKQDQQTLIDELKSRMELPWQELTPAEKKAAYYISFGEWGPRTPLYLPGERSQVFWITTGCIVASIVLFFGIRQLANPPPITMNKEWQEQSDDYLKSKNANPFTGYSQVQ